jgi:hypothetical protein
MNEVMEVETIKQMIRETDERWKKRGERKCCYLAASEERMREEVNRKRYKGLLPTTSAKSSLTQASKSQAKQAKLMERRGN